MRINKELDVPVFAIWQCRGARELGLCVVRWRLESRPFGTAFVLVLRYQPPTSWGVCVLVLLLLTRTSGERGLTTQYLLGASTSVKSLCDLLVPIVAYRHRIGNTMPIVLTLANGMQMHSFQNVQLKTGETIESVVSRVPFTSVSTSVVEAALTCKQRVTIHIP